MREGLRRLVNWKIIRLPLTPLGRIGEWKRRRTTRTMSQIEIIPAIMPESIKDLEDKVGLVAHYVSMVQLDIMDGKFVPPITWPYKNNKGTFDNLLGESEGLPFWDTVDFEIDLMIEKPEEVVDQWISAGAARLIVHVESTKKLSDIINIFRARFAYAEGKEREVELVLALDSATPLDSVLPHLEDIDGVQFMGIAKIGYQGEPFDERVIDKIRDFHNAHPEVIISIDGGVSLDNAHLLAQAGAHRLVSGSAIFNHGNVEENIHALKQADSS
jgi:ribulose-phosphate 3-epimerase